MREQKAGIEKITLDNGIVVSVSVPNDTLAGDGFYISYNARDISIYGCDTTALVVGQMEAFYILNGNHMAKYTTLIDSGLDACLTYFEANIEMVNKRSDKPAAIVPGLMW